MLSIDSPSDVQEKIAKQFLYIRKWTKHSRKIASKRTGVPEATIRHFENSGEISFRQFLMLVKIYGDLSSFDNSFPQPKARTMSELIKQNKRMR